MQDGSQKPGALYPIWARSRPFGVHGLVGSATLTASRPFSGGVMAAVWFRYAPIWLSVLVVVSCVKPRPENQRMQLGQDVLASGSTPTIYNDSVGGDAIMAGGHPKLLGTTRAGLRGGRGPPGNPRAPPGSFWRGRRR